MSDVVVALDPGRYSVTMEDISKTFQCRSPAIKRSIGAKTLVFNLSRWASGSRNIWRTGNMGVCNGGGAGRMVRKAVGWICVMKLVLAMTSGLLDGTAGGGGELDNYLRPQRPGLTELPRYGTAGQTPGLGTLHVLQGRWHASDLLGGQRRA